MYASNDKVWGTHHVRKTFYRMPNTQEVSIFDKIRNQPSKVPKYTCCICKKKEEGWGNNPYPIMENGRCCGSCNTLVIIARLNRMKDDDETQNVNK